MMRFSSSSPRIGLALGAGGARGFAHVHALEAFDDLGLVPAAIAGTSMGAIMGAARAGGFSGREVREMSIHAFQGSNGGWRRLWQLRPRGISDLFGLRIGSFDAERVLNLFLPASLVDDFSALTIPLSVVAADFYEGKEVVLCEGSVRRAIAASISLPVLFRPSQKDDMTLIDGGVVNPVPYDRFMVPVDLVVAVDVIGFPYRKTSRPLPTPLASLFGASQILMQSILAGKLAANPPDFLFRPPVNTFGVLDFLKAEAIIKGTASLKEEIKHILDQAITTYHKHHGN